MKLEEIKSLLPGEALPLLDDYLRLYPEDDEAFRIRGMKHWALGHRALAINDYHKAMSLNPESKARQALETANAILDYYNKDLLNP